uniref:Uncharacterized protein n=1 Tax=Amphimedon queenslandica TaxID=400682 RepID=A0A1X7U3Q8_AMPQE
MADIKTDLLSASLPNTRGQLWRLCNHSNLNFDKLAGGFVGRGGHGMSEPKELDLFSNLLTTHKGIRSLEERIKTVNEKISICSSERLKYWVQSNDSNIDSERKSVALSIVCDLNQEVRDLKSNRAALMKKLESAKCTLQSLYKGFVFRVLSDVSNMKMSFCLVDIFNPVYREVCLGAPISVFPPTISLDVLPEILKPSSQIKHKKDRNIAGEYVNISCGRYMYVFDKPLCASSATLGHFIDANDSQDDLTLALTTMVIQVHFVPAKEVYPKSVIDVAAEDIDQALLTVDPNNFAKSMKQCRTTVKQTFDNIRSQPLRTVEVNNNHHLADWLEVLVSDDTTVLCEQQPCRINVTYHENSKPDFCLLRHNSQCGVVVQGIEEVQQQIEASENQHQVEVSEGDTLYGIAGESKQEVFANAQLMGNMMAVAGKVAESAMKSGQHFKHIVIFGVACKYDSNVASLCKMILNFKDSSSNIMKYVDEHGQPQQTPTPTPTSPTFIWQTPTPTPAPTPTFIGTPRNLLRSVDVRA